MIKPEFFDDPAVADLTPFARLFFIGLWLHADREGILEDDIRRLKAKIFPYDDVDCEALAVELHGKDMIRRYPAVEKHGWIWIRNFLKHQRPHPKEPPSLNPKLDFEAGKLHGKDVSLHGKVEAGTSDPLESKIFTNDTRKLDIRLDHGKNGSSTLTRQVEPTPLLVFPTIGTGGSQWALRAAQVDEWRGLYPGFDVMAEIQKALAWVRADTKRRKTAGGMTKFLVGWLNRSVDAPRRPQHQPVAELRGSAAIQAATRDFLQKHPK